MTAGGHAGGRASGLSRTARALGPIESRRRGPGDHRRRGRAPGIPDPPPESAAALIRRLGGRTQAELRRELDRFFAARPELADADRTMIARAMMRFRNQLLHHPRRSLRAAADEGAADGPTLLDAVGRIIGLAEAPDGRHTGLRPPANRSPRSSTSSVAP